MRALALLLALAAAPAAAQTISLPQGCTATLSVLDRSCFWTHMFSCESDPEGSVRYVVPTEAGVIASLAGPDGEWLSTFDAGDGITWTAAGGAAPLSLRTLLETGSQSFDFTMTPDDGGLPVRVQGEERLTGETETIDGVDLQVIEYDYVITAEDGTKYNSVEGREFVTADPLSYYDGLERDRLYGTLPFDRTPTDFVHPGEPGFLSVYAPQECLDALAAAGQATEGSQ
jgi:hypothetical protein